ncbi:MAG: nuclease-related domain-containing protein [Acidimicrobiales bacterium]
MAGVGTGAGNEHPPPGWWLASDGRWYPPHLKPGLPPPPLPMAAPPPMPARAAVLGHAGRSARIKAAQIRTAAQRWEDGAKGEERTAAHLAELPAGFHVFHDLCVPGSDANIDHLVVGPTGVWLIDTKAYRAPLRLSGGTLWHGKYPVRRELDAMAGYVVATTSVLRVPLIPVLSFVDGVIPAGARQLNGVHLVALEQLHHLITSAPPYPLDVESLARLARTLRTPTPLMAAPAPPREPAPQLEADASADSGGATATVIRTTSGSANTGSGGRSASWRGRVSPTRSLPSRGPRLAVWMVRVVRVVTMLALIPLAVVLLPQVARLVSDASPEVVKSVTAGMTTTTVAPVPPPLDGPTAARPTPKPSLAMSCVEAGRGWQARLIWPALIGVAERPAAFEFTAVTEGLVIQPGLWVHRGPAPQPLTGLAPASTVTLTAQAILADGTRLQPVEVIQTVPERHC